MPTGAVMPLWRTSEACWKPFQQIPTTPTKLWRNNKKTRSNQEDEQMARRMDDLSDHEIMGVYGRYLCFSGRSTHNWRTSEREFHSNCPWCGGTDRFLVCLPSSRYSCTIRSSSCGRYGRDLIHFLRSYDQKDYFEICRMLDLNPGIATLPSRRERMVARISRDVQPPGEKWREQAGILMHIARKFMLGETGKFERNSLRVRGFTDHTIDAAGLGYLPLGKNGRWASTMAEQWGLQGDELYYYPGLYIPSSIHGQVWKINVQHGLNANPRYIQIRGSAEAMYGIDVMREGLPLVLCEGELDALSGWQACGDMANFIATGSASCCRSDHWAPLIRSAPRLLLAFDNDSAGYEAARYWKACYPWARVLRPEGGKDINMMLMLKQDMRGWLGRGIEAARDIPRLC
jgi:hypothetical protein